MIRRQQRRKRCRVFFFEIEEWTTLRKNEKLRIKNWGWRMENEELRVKDWGLRIKNELSPPNGNSSLLILNF